MTITWSLFSLWLWPTTKLTATKKSRQTLAILMAMWIRRCYAGCIAQWSASVASCKATRCCHRASAHAVLPRQQPWLMISNETKNTNKTQLLPSFLTVDRRKKAKHFLDLMQASTHVIDAANPNPYPNTTVRVEELSYILSYQT
jgi:hypothetical protein